MGGFGAYGKMPSLGDFFRIGIGPGFTDPWDRWLQSTLLAAREALGDRWQACYFSAPIWRFTLAAGLTGPDAAQGVMMPSVDRVGRQFPLTLVTLLPGAPDPMQAHLSATPVFDALEHLALDALDDAMTRDLLATRLAAQTPPPRPLSGTARRRASVWSALLADDTRFLTTEGLPSPLQVTALFDCDAAHWHTATGATS
ncbi:type VI secretion system-associated protein TagF [Paracoccaceae bacterium Fryx2]|nr:type VI secretion system-associated protein TagF [Paracoccaceae bacterium Fryx2]